MKGIRLLFLLCGHALVGAELRGTIAENGDHERALQAASCELFPACVELFGGANKVLPGSMCCPTRGGQTLSCCGTVPAPTTPGDRTNVTTPAPTIPAPAPTIPAPAPTIPAPAPTMPAPAPTMPTPAPTIPAPAPTIPAPVPTIPAPVPSVSAASCELFPACVELFGGANKVLPGSMCCPTRGGQTLSCCGTVPAPTIPGDRTDVPAPTVTIPIPDPTIPAPASTIPAPAPTIPVPIPTTPPAPTTPAVDSSCSAHPACVELFGGANKVLPGSMCCPTPYGVTLSCCGTVPAPTIPGDRTDVPAPGPTIPIPDPTIPAPAPTIPAPAPGVSAASCSLFPACVALFGGANKVLPGSMCCPTPYGSFLSCCEEV